MDNIEIEIKTVKLSELRTNTGQIPGLPANPRTMDKDSLEKLKKSLTENPEMLKLREILAIPHDGKLVIIGGNMRYRAAKELGLNELPCKIIPESTPIDALKAYVIKDNSSFGKWDFDLLANEWDADKLLEWDVPIPEVRGNETEKEAKEDNFDENEEPIVCKCKKGEIWKCGNHRVMCGDSTQSSDMEKLMGGGESGLVVDRSSVQRGNKQ